MRTPEESRQPDKLEAPARLDHRPPPSFRLSTPGMATMDIDPPHSTPPQPYAIVRIKRKRHEEPLDALGQWLNTVAAARSYLTTRFSRTQLSMRLPAERRQRACSSTRGRWNRQNGMTSSRRNSSRYVTCLMYAVPWLICFPPAETYRRTRAREEARSGS